MPDALFDEWIAQRYETLWPELFDPAVVDLAVSFLAELAGTGPALELGVGTGRRPTHIRMDNRPDLTLVVVQGAPSASRLDDLAHRSG